MKAKITKITRKPSKHGGWFYFIFFKGEDGKSYRTMTGEQFGNFRRWEDIIDNWLKNKKADKPVEVWLKGLIIKRDRIIDADCLFEIERR